MEYPKQTLTQLQKVACDLKENDQAYKIVYYEKAGKLIDKVAVYSLWKPHKEDKEYAKRSIYFLAPEQLLIFIKEQINAYLYFREKRMALQLTNSIMADHKVQMLEYLLKELRDEQLKRWKNDTRKNN